MLAVSHLLFLLALLVEDERTLRSKLVLGFFIGGVTSYVLLPVLLGNQVPRWSLHPFFVMSAAFPFFWLLARTHFSEDARVPTAAWVLAALLVLSNYMVLPIQADAGGIALPRAAPAAPWLLLPKLIAGLLDGV